MLKMKMCSPVVRINIHLPLGVKSRQVLVFLFKWLYLRTNNGVSYLTYKSLVHIQQPRKGSTVCICSLLWRSPTGWYYVFFICEIKKCKRKMGKKQQTLTFLVNPQPIQKISASTQKHTFLVHLLNFCRQAASDQRNEKHLLQDLMLLRAYEALLLFCSCIPVKREWLTSLAEDSCRTSTVGKHLEKKSWIIFFWAHGMMLYCLISWQWIYMNTFCADCAKLCFGSSLRTINFDQPGL